MAKVGICAITLVAVAALGPLGGTAHGSNVLFVNINGSYNGDGANIHSTLVSAGAAADWVNLSVNGQAATQLAAKTYDQVWVYDLSTGGDNYPADYTAIAAWHNARPDNEIICDGRIISSYWFGRWPTEGMALTENYYLNMDARSGGLLLGTDHAAFQGGINEINAQIGLQPFQGTFFLNTIPVDTNNPLMTTPNNMGATLFDDSSPGQTPYGLQPSGEILYTVAWHSNNPDTPGISSTIEGEIGMHVEITAPPNQSEFWDSEPIDLAAEASGGDAPYTYEWSHGGGPLGGGQNLQVPAGVLPLGPSTITVVATDSLPRIDDDSIQITIVPQPATQITDPTIDLKNGPPLETAVVGPYGDGQVGGLYGIYLRGDGVGGDPNYRWSISGGPEGLPGTTLATLPDTDLDGTLDGHFVTFAHLADIGAGDRAATAPYTLRLQPLDSGGVPIVGSSESEILLLVPEPATISLLAMAGLTVIRRRRSF